MPMPDVSKIIDYESGDLSDYEVLELFSDLVASGTAWSLQGSYGRMAVALIDDGYLTVDGEITAYGEALKDE